VTFLTEPVLPFSTFGRGGAPFIQAPLMRVPSAVGLSTVTDKVVVRPRPWMYVLPPRNKVVKKKRMEELMDEKLPTLFSGLVDPMHERL